MAGVVHAHWETQQVRGGVQVGCGVPGGQGLLVGLETAPGMGGTALARPRSIKSMPTLGARTHQREAAAGFGAHSGPPWASSSPVSGQRRSAGSEPGAWSQGHARASEPSEAGPAPSAFCIHLFLRPLGDCPRGT